MDMKMSGGSSAPHTCTESTIRAFSSFSTYLRTKWSGDSSMSTAFLMNSMLNVLGRR